MNEEFWNKKLNLFEIPKFQCPNCNKGLLISKEENILNEKTEQSMKSFQVIGEPEFIEGKFTTMSKCNNPDCIDITVIAGNTKVVETGMDDGLDPDTYEYIREPMPIYKTQYEVKYTNPPIKFIQISKKVPKELRLIIEESFNLFWIDASSCGNRIRTAVEKLFDLQNTKKLQGTLHQKIMEFKKINPDVANYLLALKWIGNQGSHSDQKLKRKDLVDAYRILEMSLEDLYSNSRIEVNNLSNQINQKKGGIN